MFLGIETFTLFCLFGVGMIAGFFDAITGGGGLVTLPALFFAGIDPVIAIATNKVQAYASTFSATLTFAKKRMINWRLGLPISIMSFIGSVIGALSVSLLPRIILDYLIPILLIIAAFYFTFSSKINNSNNNAKISTFIFSVTIAVMLGFYDGIFGPGVGSFIMLCYISLLGFSVTEAIIHTRLTNAASNLGALTVFISKGIIIWPVGLVMAFGAFIGAQIGASCAIRISSNLIRILLSTVCIFMALSLLFNT